MQAKEEVIFTIIVIVLVLVFLAILFLVFLTKNNMRKNRMLFENERIKKEYEQALLNTRLEIQEQTLDYISHEIHDNIGQTLSLARIQINNEDNPESLDISDELLGKAITDLRTLSHSLNTNHIKDSGFAEAVRLLAEQFERTGKYKVFFDNSINDFNVDDEKGLILFRVIQEVLNNISRHAAATEIRLKLSDVTNGFEIAVSDNGRGFDPSTLKSEGIGLRNIRDRIKIINGNLDLKSEIGQGTMVKITLPHEHTRN